MQLFAGVGVGVGVRVGGNKKLPALAFAQSYEPIGSAAVLNSTADAILQYTINYVAATTDANVRFRAPANDATFWRLRAQSNGTLTLYEFDGTTQTPRANIVTVFPTTGAYNISVVLSGANITVYVNGVQKILYPSATAGQTLPNWKTTAPSPSTMINLTAWPSGANVTL